MRFKSKGFTLIELLVVLVILGLAAGMLAPKVGSGWQRMRERDFLSGFAAEMRKARIDAMKNGGCESFRINGGDKRFGYERPLENEIPANVDIFADGLEQDALTGDFLVRFHADGSVSGSDMEVIFDGERKYLVIMDPMFGTVRVSRDEVGF
jgi:general secretion pathway protein H